MRPILPALFVGIFTLAATPATEAETFIVDQAHTKVGFKVRHLGISSVEGHFDKFEGTIEADPENLEDLVLSATVEVGSVNTGNEKRDEHLRSADFFDVEKYPTMTFKSAKVEKDGDELEVKGELTLHGVTKEIELELEIGGVITDPWGNKRMGLSGSAKIDRQEFGLSFNQILETGQLMVGDEVRIQLEIEAVQKK
ncbi:MAG: polyisoprenoid-binding protein [Candidatus Omnitrophica bacterium]|nr:polyisoprenoid-binding protein [Candidatus Omnitrophota bacterium]